MPGSTAKRMPQKESLSSMDFGVIVSDYRLPGMANGIDVLRRQRDKLAAARLVLITAFGSHEVQNEAAAIRAKNQHRFNRHGGAALGAPQAPDPPPESRILYQMTKMCLELGRCVRYRTRIEYVTRRGSVMAGADLRKELPWRRQRIRGC